MDGESAYYAVDVEEAAARLQETPDRVREMLVTGELEGIPPGATAQGDWKVLLPASPDMQEPAPADEPPEARSEEHEEAEEHDEGPPPEEAAEEFVEAPETARLESAAEKPEDPVEFVAPPTPGEPPVGVFDEIPDESPSEAPGEVREGVRSDAGESGWTSTKQAAKVLGVSRRSVQGYVRRGLLEAREEGEGVSKTFLIDIDSLNALRDRRRREAGEAAKIAEVSEEQKQAPNVYANAGEALRYAIDRVEARTAEAIELRVRLEITEKAESTLRAELEEERRRREEAERERDELRRRLDAGASPERSPEEPRESSPAPAATAAPERVEQQSPTPPVFSQGSSGRRPWWRRMLGG